jgi:hypothetical protein
VSDQSLAIAEAAATALHLVHEGTVYLLSKGATEATAATHFYLASAAYAKCDGIGALPPVPDSPNVITFGMSPYINWFERSNHPIARESRTRLERLLDDDDCAVTSIVPGDPRIILQSFFKSNPAWLGADDSCELVFRRYPSVLNAIILRVQTSGLCFIHAPLTALHYLRNMVSTCEETVDITTFMRCNIDDVGTAAYVYSDTGGSAESVLRQVVLPGTLLASCNFDSVAVSDLGPELRRLLSLYGPGIVTTMGVERALVPPRTSFAGRCTSPLLGLYAVVLVGVRLSPVSRKHFMLLQNSHAGLPFFEVDEDYWFECKAEVSFVRTPQPTARPGFMTNSLVVAESGVVGAGVAAPFLY